LKKELDDVNNMR